MRHQPLNPELFIFNREKFTSKLLPNSIAIFNASPQYPRNGDANLPYRPHSELYWLTGIPQEETCLILFPDCPNPDLREILFLRETNEHIAVWEGHKFTVAEGIALSGIKKVMWTSSFEGVFRQLMNYADHVYLNTNENDRSTYFEDGDIQFANRCKREYPLHQYHRAATILREVRSAKHEEEIKTLRKAISITENAFYDVLKFVKPGTMEYEVEAKLIHRIIASGGNGFSFDPIVASGPSACVLHYIENNKRCEDGHLMLLDFGTDYGFYAADMTRCFPINSKFTDRQKQVYNAVRNVMKQAVQLLHTGNSLNDYNTQAALIMEAELLKLGLITQEDIKNQNPEWPAYKKYFMHGTGHFLGIDTHDIGRRYEKLPEGAVITLEPGIYIPEEGLGIRIENDILVTAQGPIDLMEGVAIEVDEIEAIMQAR